jgi:hypothetical protein
LAFNVLNRKVHYWASFIVAAPLLAIICSGLLLQMKKHWSWVQPSEHRGSSAAPLVDFDGILASVKAVPDLAVRDWTDVDRLDVRPGRGVAKVTLHSGWEVQVDLGSGRVLLLLWCGGMWMWWVPFIAKRRKAAVRARHRHAVRPTVGDRVSSIAE